MTPEEQAEIGMSQSKLIAEQMATLLLNSTDSSKVAVYAAAITFAGICSSEGVSMHTAINVFMSIYKQIDCQNQNEFIQ